jgi:hypothetical protein
MPEVPSIRPTALRQAAVRERGIGPSGRVGSDFMALFGSVRACRRAVFRPCPLADREWASAQTLPFPDLPEANRKQIRDTLDYPPAGSPDADRG